MADLITAAQLRAIAGGKAPLAAKIAESFNPLAAPFGLTTPLRLAHFLSQLSHESGGFRFIREVWGPTAAQKGYEGRRDLGNVHPGDGSRYRGRGPIQVTGRANYAAFTAWIRRRYPEAPDFEADPAALEQFPWALMGAFWFWDTRGLNALADADDVLKVTRKINGGTNGLADRKAALKRAKAVFGIGEAKAARPAPGKRTAGAAPAPEPIPAVPAPGAVAPPIPAPPAAPVVPARKPGIFGGLFARVLGRADAAAPVATPLPAELTRGDPAVFRVQRALADRGYAEVGEIDGVIGGAGSKTRAAIRAAQAESGLAITGEMDAAFLAALPTMPARAIPPARAGATVQDLRAAGSTPVAAADGLGMLGRILLGGGALGGLDASGALTKVKDTADQATAAVQSIQGVINAGIGGVQWVAAHWWLVAVPVGLWAALSATKRLLEIRALYRQGAITRAGA